MYNGFLSVGQEERSISGIGGSCRKTEAEVAEGQERRTGRAATADGAGGSGAEGGRDRHRGLLRRLRGAGGGEGLRELAKQH